MTTLKNLWIKLKTFFVAKWSKVTGIFKKKVEVAVTETVAEVKTEVTKPTEPTKAK